MLLGMIRQIKVSSDRFRCVIREVKHDVYGKRQTAKMKLLPSVFSSLYSKIKTFVSALNSKRHFSIFVKTSNPNPWQLNNVTCKTRDKGQLEKIQNITSLPRCNCGQTQTVPQENHGQTMLKMSSISDLKRPTVP